MAKKSAGSPVSLFLDSHKKRHPRLFLPRLLNEEARSVKLDGPELQSAFSLLNAWADLAEKGHLNQKETALDAEFLEKVFGDALGYRSLSENPADYHREKQFTVAGAGTADGALGRFVSGKTVAPVAVIELKGAATDLDHDKFNSRTPVDQLWDYLNQLPDTPWGIVSNYVTIRLYHRDRPKRAYEEFTITDLRDPARFRQFFCLFHRNGLLGNKVQSPRTLALLTGTAKVQKQVGEDLYEDYSNQRLALIQHLMLVHGKDQDAAIHIAQKIIDRIVFVAFCEDRSLLPEGLIQKAYKQLPAFTKVTNPKWQNFKGLFGLIDKGDADHGIPEFNGGLFRRDDAVDDLELEDEWTRFFNTVDGYDFKDEVNVEVLGNLFEKSITELEKLRVVGLFGKQAAADGLPMMPKSAMRKRFGVYYTPPQFTELIVDKTLGELIRERIDPLPDAASKIAALRKLRCVDPACGSGAFLIAAYERLEDAYENVARRLRIDGDVKAADTLTLAYPDYILSGNLYGADLSAEAVEITQLALWIRSARKGRTLADLSKNIVCGNSLVRDPVVHPKAMVWAEKFPAVFAGDEPGFDVVVGNPPWERMKLQEREFFALAAPEIASSNKANARKQLVATLETTQPDLWARYREAVKAAELALKYARTSGHYPLAGRGDVNTYMLFSELARHLVAAHGRTGLLVPSGIATDNTMKDFFGALVENQTLGAVYDFVNRLGLFPDVEGRLKFCILLMNGPAVKTELIDFVFWAESVEDLGDLKRHVKLSVKDLKLMNPNTLTCPVFRNDRDADLTRHVYRRVPVLLDRNRTRGGNPWGIRFVRMFDQTNDADKFVTPKQLKSDGFKLAGNKWAKQDQTYLPLLEAKMTRDYDHRASKVELTATNWYMNYSAEYSSLVEHQNPEFLPMGRWWVEQKQVIAASSPSQQVAAIAFHDIARATDQRTMVACMLPFLAVSNTLPLILNEGGLPWRTFACLLGNLNSFAYDFVTRQKAGGSHLNFFIVEQLPTLPPDRYDDPCPWAKKTRLVDWISERVLKLTCTSDDMIPLAEAAGFTPRVHPWKEDDRAKLRAELDAAFFRLYDLSREDVEYILSTFQGVVKEDEAHGGEGPTRRLVIDAYDAL